MKSMIVFASLLSYAFAALNGPCTSQGIQGTCRQVSNCTTGYTVVGACPDDPSDVLCCLSAGCTNPENGAKGSCFDSNRIPCGINGGPYITDQCPGPAEAQCCVKVTIEQATTTPTHPKATGNAGGPTPDPTPNAPPTPPPFTPPSTPGCSSVTGIIRDLMPGIRVDKAITKKIGGVAGQEVASGAAVVEAICGIAGPEAAAVCAIPVADLAIVAEHASECVSKNQCLEITIATIPIIGPSVAVPWCVGANDGCC